MCLSWSYKMFETKTGLRKFATLITVAAFVFAATPPANSAVKYASTVRFIASKFVNKQYVEGFSAGKADYGFTIESLLQLRAAGQTANSFKPAVEYNLQNASVVGTSSTKVGAHYVDQKFQSGRGAMFLVASKAYGLPKSALRTNVLTSLKASIKPTGEIADANGNTFEHQDGAESAVANRHDFVTLDSAGRLHLSNVADLLANQSARDR